MFEDMQRRWFYRTVRQPLVFSVVLVRKENWDLGFCVDYKKLNDRIRKDCFPLLRIDDTLDTLAGAKWFSTLDLKTGYWQVDLHPEDKKTLFSAGQGLSQFTFILFGL
jgi:hypothetical protein